MSTPIRADRDKAELLFKYGPPTIETVSNALTEARVEGYKAGYRDGCHELTEALAKKDLREK